MTRPQLPYPLHPECCWPYRPEKVKEYVELLRKGCVPPAITLCGGMLLDGVHRLEAWLIVYGNAKAIPTQELEPGISPGAFVHREHQGTRELSIRDMAHVIAERMHRTGRSLEECLNDVPPLRRGFLKREVTNIQNPDARPTPRAPKPRPLAGEITLIVPDSHGEHIDVPARDALIEDCRALGPKRVILLGDHLDCGGFLSTHQRSYTKELTESYTDDCKAANEFLDLLQAAAPRAEFHYLEGNHEFHVERWASREIPSAKDAVNLLERLGPEAVLDLKRRGIQYYRQSEKYFDLPIPGTIKFGKCVYTHGIGASQHATDMHVRRFGSNIVHGHTHRSQSSVIRTVSAGTIGGFCPGTLAKLQMLYNHTRPTDWSHGYAVQFAERSGRFMHLNVPIFDGQSLLRSFLLR